jgi:hypothetical protein
MSLSPDYAGAPVAANESEGQASAFFMKRVLEDAGQRVDLQSRLQRLGAGTREPAVDRLVRVKITDWCWLLIEAEKLRELSREDADDIGRVIYATLTNPLIKKGDKP